MDVLVPYDAREPNTRLGPFLTASERQSVARTMLADVLDTLSRVGVEPTLLATEAVAADVPVRVDERPLSPAVNAALAERNGPVAVVMADLALATPAAIDRLLTAEGDVVLAPGLGGGTNALLSRDPDFRVDYHGVSYRDHRATAQALGAAVTTVDSFRLAVDIDNPEDLADVLVHGEGQTADHLRELGVTITSENRCLAVSRSGENSGESG